MDINALMLSMLFSTIGLGLFLYGKKVGRIIPLGTGLLLMILPYFIPNLWLQTIVCCLLISLPWLGRNA